MTLPDHIRTLLTDARFVTISTTDEDGAPRNAVVWCRLDGEDVVINSLVGRRWPTNLVRDPRIAIAVVDGVDGLGWVGLTGSAEAITDQATAQADIAAMSRHFHADDPEEGEKQIRERFETQERISFRVVVESFHDHLA